MKSKDYQDAAEVLVKHAPHLIEAIGLLLRASLNARQEMDEHDETDRFSGITLP